MRIAHKFVVGVITQALFVVLSLVPGHGHGQSAHVQDFGDYSVRFSAISTMQLPAGPASKYAIARSNHQGLVNIAVERKGEPPRMVSADVSGTVTDLFGHALPVRFIRTDEAGEIDYLGVFELNGSGNYRFKIDVVAQGKTRAYTVRFNRDYFVD